MASISLSLSPEYWQTLQINKKDIEILHNYLFESETPLTSRELVVVLIEERVRAEQEAQAKKRKSDGKLYLPKERYTDGEHLVFPALDWAKGAVSAVRSGVNPQYGEFDVLTVEMENGQSRMFAAGLAEHTLNEETATDQEADNFNPNSIHVAFGTEIERKLEDAFAEDDGLVRIAGRWFPRALLVDVNQGHLNLAEAVLDMAGGEPLPTHELLKNVELPEGVNPKLAEFSLNLALQEDGRLTKLVLPGKSSGVCSAWSQRMSVKCRGFFAIIRLSMIAAC